MAAEPLLAAFIIGLLVGLGGKLRQSAPRGYSPTGPTTLRPEPPTSPTCLPRPTACASRTNRIRDPQQNEAT